MCVARAGLGPSPGWGPLRVGAHMGPYMGPCGPIWALMGHPGQVLEKVSTFRKTISINFACFGSKIDFLIKFLDDSAWLCMEKLKNTVLRQKTKEHTKNTKEISKRKLKKSPL